MENQNDIDIIELKDEDGNKLTFEHLLTFEVEDNFYIAMVPTEDMEGLSTEEVLIMKIEDDGDESVYLPIETEEELDSLWNIFNELYYADEEDDDE